jgi:epoxyqueuosine reductase
LCGIAPVDAFPELAFLREWIDRGYAGTMAYLPRTAGRRSDVRRVVPTAKSVIMMGTLYNTDYPYSTQRSDKSVAEVARYATSDDYHDVIGRRLNALLDWMREQHPEPFEARAYVDTGPVQERVYAQYAGLGWIGKNTCLINADAGSWMVLSEIICSIALERDTPALDQCGTCNLCIEACPTGAFVEPHVLDATKCISYLTIEYRGAIADDFHEAMGNHVFGCDICQEVCPWNGAPLKSNDNSWPSRSELGSQSLQELSAKPDDELQSFIQGTPLSRAGVKGLRRNLEIALKNARLTAPAR